MMWGTFSHNPEYLHGLSHSVTNITERIHAGSRLHLKPAKSASRSCPCAPLLVNKTMYQSVSNFPQAAKAMQSGTCTMLHFLST